MENIHIWTDFKALVDLKNPFLQYEESNDNYVIWFNEGITVYRTTVYKRSGDVDCADFEDNYKVDSNKSKNILNIKKAITITSYANVTGVGQDILEYIVPAGKKFYLTDIIVGGDVIDRKELKFNVIPRLRMCHRANEGQSHPFKSPLKVNSGVTIRIKNKVATSGVHVATIGGVLYNA